MIRERVELSAIQKAAGEARKQFEDRKVDPRALKKLYAAYNPDIGDVALFVQRACELFPQLNCGVASVYLRAILNLGTVTQGRYGDEDHTFLLIENEQENPMVVDVTSDQYGGPRVYVGPLQAPWGLKQKCCQIALFEINGRKSSAFRRRDSEQFATIARLGA